MKKMYAYIYVDADDLGQGSINVTKKIHLNGIKKLLQQMVKI